VNGGGVKTVGTLRAATGVMLPIRRKVFKLFRKFLNARVKNKWQQAATVRLNRPKKVVAESQKNLS
jgi:hypothetical protein